MIHRCTEMDVMFHSSASSLRLSNPALQRPVLRVTALAEECKGPRHAARR